MNPWVFCFRGYCGVLFTGVISVYVAIGPWVCGLVGVFVGCCFVFVCLLLLALLRDFGFVALCFGIVIGL